eukprot:scaffold655_cov162-Amphora_coffeaeformis.AAC.7
METDQYMVLLAWVAFSFSTKIFLRIFLSAVEDSGIILCDLPTRDERTLIVVVGKSHLPQGVHTHIVPLLLSTPKRISNACQSCPHPNDTPTAQSFIFHPCNKILSMLRRPDTGRTQRGVALVGAYFATYFAIGFVYPFLSGGNTVLGTMVHGNNDSSRGRSWRQQIVKLKLWLGRQGRTSRFSSRRSSAATAASLGRPWQVSLGGWGHQLPIGGRNDGTNGTIHGRARRKVRPNQTRLGTTRNDTFGSSETGMHVGKDALVSQTMQLSAARGGRLVLPDVGTKGGMM